MTLKQMEYFAALAQCKNFTQAASQCFTSQPNLSRQIAALEDEVGARLLIRDRHRVELTDAGAVLEKHGGHILAHYAQMMQEIQALERGAPVILGMMNGIHVLFDCVKELLDARKYPNLHTVHAAERHYLTERRVDICFLILLEPDAPCSMPLFRQNTPVVIPKSIYDGDSPPSLDELQHLEFLVPQGAVQNLILQKLSVCGGPVKIHPYTSPYFDYDSFLVEALLHGYATFRMVDSLGKYEDAFHVFDIPDLELEIPVGLQWNPEKDAICRNIAADISKIFRRQAGG